MLYTAEYIVGYIQIMEPLIDVNIVIFLMLRDMNGQKKRDVPMIIIEAIL